jgi:hypothetical protein
MPASSVEPWKSRQKLAYKQQLDLVLQEATKGTEEPRIKRIARMFIIRQIREIRGFSLTFFTFAFCILHFLLPSVSSVSSCKTKSAYIRLIRVHPWPIPLRGPLLLGVLCVSRISGHERSSAVARPFPPARKVCGQSAMLLYSSQLFMGLFFWVSESLHREGLSRATMCAFRWVMVTDHRYYQLRPRGAHRAPSRRRAGFRPLR